MSLLSFVAGLVVGAVLTVASKAVYAFVAKQYASAKTDVANRL